MLAGGLGGTLKTGRTLNYLEAGEDNRKLCSLFLSIMDRMEVKLDHFGDAETRLGSCRGKVRAPEQTKAGKCASWVLRAIARCSSTSAAGNACRQPRCDRFSFTASSARRAN